MLKPLLKKAIPLLAMIPLLGSCSLFQPQTKVIEYDEEVKLHDGSMIWVHIKRHYGLVGGVPSGHDKSYMPGAVEISWDTGFEGVGRKSVFFQEDLMIINKYNDKWYVIGGLPYSAEKVLGEAVNCKLIGVAKIQICIATLDTHGNFIKSNENDISAFNNMNILNPNGIKDWGLFPMPLNGKKISWKDKLDLQNQQTSRFQKINKPIAILN